MIRTLIAAEQRASACTACTACFMFDVLQGSMCGCSRATCDAMCGLQILACHVGEYVRFQPRTADFQKEVGPDVRAVLEAALERHSTLSEGDWISVPFAGRTFDLTVQKLRPGRAVSVIGEFCTSVSVSAKDCSCAQTSHVKPCGPACECWPWCCWDDSLLRY